MLSGRGSGLEVQQAWERVRIARLKAATCSRFLGPQAWEFQPVTRGNAASPRPEVPLLQRRRPGVLPGAGK